MTRCAIVCSGPSLKGLDLSKIDVPKIGVNWSFKATPSDIHVISSYVFVERHRNDLVSLTPEARHRFSALPLAGAEAIHARFRYCTWQEYLTNPVIPQMPAGYDVRKHGWVFAGGGPCALQVAVSFGFTEVVFVGLDLMGEHFYTERYINWPQSTLDQAWAIQAAYFRKTKAEMAALGMSIRNVGTFGGFPRVRFEEVWP